MRASLRADDIVICASMPMDTLRQFNWVKVSLARDGVRSVRVGALWCFDDEDTSW